MPSPFRLRAMLLFLGLTAWSAALAANPLSPVAVELKPVKIEGKAPSPDPTTTRLKAADLARDNVLDERDMLRGQTGVSLSDGGRAGSNGYAMRGVDGNRVSIMVDGVAQAEYFLPGVYSGYGYMNGNRNSVELENMKAVTIQKGADSFQSGSGGIGGSVQFVTKDIDDFVAPDKTVGAVVKSGYASRDRQWLRSAGAGVRFGQGNSLLVQYTRRNGHETRHYGGGADIYGARRGRPDPASMQSDAWLSAFKLCVVPAHCVALSYAERKSTRQTHELSYDGFGRERRTAWDSSPYQRRGIRYDWSPSSGPLQSLGVSLVGQHVLQRALTVNHEDDGFVGQRYDRRTGQRNRQWQWHVQARPWATALGTHHVSVGWQRDSRQLSNDNHDTVHFRRSSGGSKRYRIIDSATTRDIAFKLKDRVVFNERWQAEAGWRLDRVAHRRRQGETRSTLADDPAANNKAFSASSGFAQLTYTAASGLGVAYGVSQGFRAPSAQEMYFHFQRGPNFFIPNADLKAERALTQEVTLSAQGAAGFAALTLFQSRYRDFIEERHSQRQVPNPWFDMLGGSPWSTEEIFRTENVDRASVQGVEFNGFLDAFTTLGAPRGLGMDLKLSWVRGRTSLGDGLRALQPPEAVLGLAYEAPSSTWGVRLQLVYRGAKKARDTLRTIYGFRGPKQFPATYLNQAVVLADLSGHVALTRQVSLNVGVYNLFDRRYFRWDSLRAVPEFGNTSRVRGAGLNRLTAPGRNVAINLVARF